MKVFERVLIFEWIKETNCDFMPLVLNECMLMVIFFLIGHPTTVKAQECSI